MSETEAVAERGAPRGHRPHKHFPIRKGILIERTVGHVKAVDGVSFEIAGGETLGLVGESGSGKSTTGYCILQLLKPTVGLDRVHGQGAHRARPRGLRRMRREMQIVFQDPYASLDPRMTVGGIVAEPLEVHGIGTRGAARDRPQAPRHRRLQPELHEPLSARVLGRPAQRIGIARALALNPKLIVCDEPVSALDVSIQAQILNLSRTCSGTSGSPTSSSPTTSPSCAR